MKKEEASFSSCFGLRGDKKGGIWLGPLSYERKQKIHLDHHGCPRNQTRMGHQHGGWTLPHLFGSSKWCLCYMNPRLHIRPATLFFHLETGHSKSACHALEDCNIMSKEVPLHGIVWQKNIDDRLLNTLWLGVIILQFPEKELRENLGLILDFPRIPNQSEF